jgi:diguanylate cyclase (GGDEF)-like protein/PAS domain S-box-containing protein
MFQSLKSNIALKLTGFMLAVSVLPVLVLQTVSYQVTRQTIIDVATAHGAQLLANQRDYLNLQTDQIHHLAENPAWVSELVQLQRAATAGSGAGTAKSYDELTTQARIGQLLSAYSGLSGLDSIDLFTLKGAQYHVGEAFSEAESNSDHFNSLLSSALATPGQVIWQGVEMGLNQASHPRKVIVATKAIYKLDPTGLKTEPIGLLRMNYSAEYLHDHFNTLELGVGSYLLLVDAQQRLLFHPDMALVGQPIAPGLGVLMRGASGLVSVRIGGEEMLLSYLQIPDKQWYMIRVVPLTTLVAPMVSIERTGAALLLVSLLLIVLFLRLYWQQVVRPIRAVSDGFRQFQANQLDPHWRLPKPRAWVQIGELVTWFNAFLDSVQAGRQSEADLRESEAHNRALINAIPDLIFTNRRDGEYLTVQASNPGMLYLPPPFFLGKKVLDVLPQPVADQFMKAFVEALDSQATQQLNYVLPVGGEERTFEARVAPCTEDTVISIVRDVSERARAEEELRIAATAFESQEGVLVTDFSGAILRVNHAFTVITGYTAPEAVGRNSRMLASGRHGPAFYADMWKYLVHQGFWQGEIWNRRKSGEVFPEWLTVSAVKNVAGQTTHYVAVFSDLTQRKNAEDQIQSLAFYDPLTQLPNRRLLLDRLEQAMAASCRHQRKGALLFVDLDNFKILNETISHVSGDLLLEQVARRLSTCIREGDTVARVGGDEFVVMLQDLSEIALEAATQAEAVGDKILTVLDQTYELAHHEYHGTASVGITLFGGELHESIEEPLKRADLAMYHAKAAGRNTLRFFEPQMQAVVTERATLEADLREALVRDQFMLYYQAQVRGDGQLVGAEALLRWQHPRRGRVSPAEFISLAEDTGLILPLGLWVLTQACTQLATWATHPALAQLTVAVNVSARQFLQRDFVEQVLAVLERSGAKAQLLKLELTESLLVTNIEDIISKMNALKAKGVGFSLDDFGIGYSSLSYLKRLPLDQLKIDQSFVRDVLIDPNDAAIAKMVIVLADSLGLLVVAEGVETVAQRDFLAGQGCQAYQGYLFAHPIPAPEFEVFAAQSSGAPG